MTCFNKYLHLPLFFISSPYVLTLKCYSEIHNLHQNIFNHKLIFFLLVCIFLLFLCLIQRASAFSSAKAVGKKRGYYRRLCVCLRRKLLGEVFFKDLSSTRPWLLGSFLLAAKKRSENRYSDLPLCPSNLEKRVLFPLSAM